MIPFSPPRIDDRTIAEVVAALQSGWITTGPRTKQFEKEITNYCQAKTTVCVSSWTMGMQVLLHWWGVGEGDEVIVPCYTYCASGNVVLHSGAKLVLVDIGDDFNLNVAAVADAITPRTKVIMPVDIGGLPCDYEALYSIIQDKQQLFSPSNQLQKQLNRILLVADAAHSFGAKYRNKVSGALADITVFSFHAVKNLTTAEGGAIVFNLPVDFNHEEIYRHFCTLILHGQSKDALAKTKAGGWKYDVVAPGFKCNMTDLQAAIGLVELNRYAENLERRKQIMEFYLDFFKAHDWAILPQIQSAHKTSAYHLFLLRIAGISEAERDAMITTINELGVAVNVHFQPLPLLTAYKNLGYDIADYPNAYLAYANEISLPVYYDLTDEQLEIICNAVVSAYQKVSNEKSL
jgi:dTDP-4-amino-4,6-dideoxygalactose transaminase